MILQSHSQAYLQRKLIQKDTDTLMSTAALFIYYNLNLFILAALFIIAKTWKQPKCPSTDDWITMWSIHTVEYYSATKRMKSRHLQLGGWTRGLSY